METLRDIDLDVRPAEFVAQNPELRGKTAKIAKEALSQAFALARPVAYLRIERVRKLEKGRLSLLKDTRPGTELQINQIASAFRHSQYAVPFICTLGEKVDEGLKRYKRKGDPLRTWLYDLACSYLAEKLAEHVQETVAKRYKGLQPTHRFSPGYCDWKLSEQKKLFDMFDHTDIEVELSESCMMSPKKSVSAIFGLGKRSSHEANPCNACRKSGCGWRRD